MMQTHDRKGVTDRRRGEAVRQLRKPPPASRTPNNDLSLALSTLPSAIALPDPTAIQAELGSGHALDAPVRGRMERAFGHDFGDVRIHDDSTADRANRNLGSRAFTVGSRIAFGAGQFRPGSLRGDLLIAHELAHVMQQTGAAAAPDEGHREAAIERDATRAAVDALTPGQAARPTMREPLALRRCNGEGDGEPGPTTVTPAPPPPAPAEPTPATPPPVPRDEPLLDLSDIEWRPVASVDDVLMLTGPNRSLYLLPARGLVYEPLPPRAPQGTPQPRSFGIPAAGHAATYLVRTGLGVGVLIDAGGTRSGRPNVLLPASLAFISARMGITQIQGAVLSHTHADHVANFESFVNAGLVTGNQVFVYPGWERARTGPLAALYNAMRDARYTAQGFGPGWQPTQIATRDVAGVTTSTLQIGGARIDVVTRTADLQRYVAELRAGRTGTRFADAASMLTRVRQAGAAFDITVVGDIRGATLADLHDQMGATTFNDFFRDTRVLGGLQHHLGAVNSARDVRGLILLLRAARTADFQISAIVQTDAGRNMDLVRQLQEAGVRVYALGAIDPAAPAGVTVRPTGQIEAPGATVYDPRPEAQQARSRIENLTRAAEVLESHPGLIRVGGATHAEVAAGLRAEAERLRTEVYARQELALGETHRSTRRADYAARLAANTAAIQAVQGMEAAVGTDGIRYLRRLRERADEMQREIVAARTAGRASERLRRLVAEVEPDFARAVLADEYGRATSQRGLLRAQRRAEARLRRQVELQRALTAGGQARVSVGARRVAIGLVALEIFNLLAPFIQYAVDQYRDRRMRDFYVFLTIGTWWHEKLAPVPLRARRGGAEVPQEEDLTASALRRIWEDAPTDRRRPLGDLAQTVREARPLEAVWIPRLADWPAPQPIWDAFRLWVSIHVEDFNDYASEFLDIPNPAIRRRGGFQTGEWDVKTGAIDSDGHVQETWEHSQELTRIMRATAEVVIAGTEREIDEQWRRRGEPENRPPMVTMPGTRLPPPRQRLARARFRSSGSPVYGAFRPSPTRVWETREITTFRFFNDEPYFQVYELEPAPSGMVLVGGADYDTAAAIRSQDTWQDDPDRIVPIPKRYVPPLEALPVEPERTPQQAAALAAVRQGRAERYFYPEPIAGTNPYDSEVHFPYWGPNVFGRVFVRRSDLHQWER